MSDWMLAACTAIGALVYLYADSRIPDPVIADPLGPKAFPALVGIGLLVSAALLFVEAWKKRRVRLSSVASTPDERRYYAILIGMVAWTAAYYTAFEPVGYVLSTVVYLLGLLAYFNRSHPWVNVVIAIGFTGVAYAVFARFLGVAMPGGLLAS